MKNLCTTLFLFLLTGLLLEASANVIYVDSSAPDGGTGTSWATAYNKLQDALAAAQPGDEIHVAEGAYTPDGPNGDPAAWFLIDKDLVLIGGYQSGGTDYDPALYKTILSGDLNGNDTPGDFTTGKDDNVWTVVRVNQNISATFDGFTIENGYANGPSFVWEVQGGGLHCGGGADVTVKNCIFQYNFASESGGAIHSRNNQINLENCTFLHNKCDGAGGGLMLENATGILTNCHFSENLADAGGGLYASASSSALFTISVSLLDCDFQDNFANNWGGGAAMFTWKDSTQFIVDRCTFSGNGTDRWGGGLRAGTLTDPGGYVAKNTLISIDSCTFVQNTAAEDGGGLFAQALHKETNFSLTNTIFDQNSSAGFGGGATVFGGGPGTGVVTVQACTFLENSSEYTGGGLSIGSPGYAQIDPGLKKYFLTECHFENNATGELGGGIELYSCFNLPAPDSFFIARCTWMGNEANGVGGGIGTSVENSGMAAFFSDCTWNNNSSPFGGAVGAAPFFTKTGSSTTSALLRFENCLMTENTSDTATIALRKIGRVELFNCTIADNQAGGVAMDAQSIATIQNTILANASQEFNAFDGDAMLTSGGGNLVKDGSLNSGNPADFENQTPIFNGSGESCEFYKLDTLSPGYNGGVVWNDVPEKDACGNTRIWDGQIDVGAIEWTEVSSTQEMVTGKLNVSPNPAADLLNIEWPETLDGPAEMQVYNLQGQLLLTPASAAVHTVDVRALPSGIYLLKMVADGKYFSTWFVKI